MFDVIIGIVFIILGVSILTIVILNNNREDTLEPKLVAIFCGLSFVIHGGSRLMVSFLLKFL